MVKKRVSLGVPKPSRKKRNELMEDLSNFIALLALILWVLLIILALALIYTGIISSPKAKQFSIKPEFAPPSPDFPPSFNQFYGSVRYSDGTSLGSGAVVYAYVDSAIEASGAVINDQYGYDSAFTIENIAKGKTIAFMIKMSDGSESQVANYDYVPMEITNLNLVYPKSTTPPPGGGGGGGGGGSASIVGLGGSEPQTPDFPSVPRICEEYEETDCGIDVGTCSRGIQICLNNQWSKCQGSINPVEEFCTDGLDNDCDGLTDEDCEVIVEVPRKTKSLVGFFIVILSVLLVVIVLLTLQELKKIKKKWGGEKVLEKNYTDPFKM